MNPTANSAVVFPIFAIGAVAWAACASENAAAPKSNATGDSAVAVPVNGDDVDAGAGDSSSTETGSIDESEGAASTLDAASVIDEAPTLSDCPCFAGDGIYCGGAIETYGATHTCSAPDLAQHKGDLYECKAGAWSIASACPSGCYIAPPAQSDGCHVDGGTKKLWIVFNPRAKARDLPGMFLCLLTRTNFNALVRAYPSGYGLQWGGSLTADCGMNEYACAVSALQKSGVTVSDHDVIEIILPGYCGGDNNARRDGVQIGNIRVRGANLGDCGGGRSQERVAVHEAFEAVGDWANADCCTGEVNADKCADNGEAFCPGCPCSCGRYQADGTYGVYTLDCGGGHVYSSQRVPSSPADEFNPDACIPIALVQ